MEKIALIDHTQIEKDVEESGTKENNQDEDLDLLNFYVKEMREPVYQATGKSKKSKPCKNFNRLYLPNGQQVALKSF